MPLAKSCCNEVAVRFFWILYSDKHKNGTTVQGQIIPTTYKQLFLYFSCVELKVIKMRLLTISLAFLFMLTFIATAQASAVYYYQQPSYYGYYQPSGSYAYLNYNSGYLSAGYYNYPSYYYPSYAYNYQPYYYQPYYYNYYGSYSYGGWQCQTYCRWVNSYYYCGC